MSDRDFTVQRLDHVHVSVSNRSAAIAWYRKVMGLKKHYDYTEHGDPHGPVMLSSDGGDTHLALFETKRVTPAATIAFRIDGAGFLEFLHRLSTLELRDSKGARVSKGDLSDHGNSWSVYFCDPDGNPYEITTYDYALVKQRLPEV